MKGDKLGDEETTQAERVVESESVGGGESVEISFNEPEDGNKCFRSIYRTIQCDRQR